LFFRNYSAMRLFLYTDYAEKSRIRREAICFSFSLPIDVSCLKIIIYSVFSEFLSVSVYVFSGLSSYVFSDDGMHAAGIPDRAGGNFYFPAPDVILRKFQTETFRGEP
jgi:hypothetical protein